MNLTRMFHADLLLWRQLDTHKNCVTRIQFDESKQGTKTLIFFFISSQR